MKEILDKNQFQSSNLHSDKMFFDISVALTICLAPFLIFLHLLFSENTNVFYFFGLEFIHKYPDNQVFAWSILISLIPFILTVIIFFTTQRIWRYFLLPLLVFLFIATLLVFTNYWEEHKYLFKLEGIIWAFFFIENLLFYDDLIFRKFRIQRFEISRKEIWEEIIYGRYDKLNRSVKDILMKRKFTSLNLYMCKIYYILQILNQKYPGEKKEPKICARGYSISWNDMYKGMSLLLISVLLLIYTLVPSGVEKIDIKLFEIGTFGFNSVQTLVWYALNRIALLILFVWCFIQCYDWWKWSLLSPIIFYSYQLWEIFIKMRIDELQNIVLLSPVLILLVIIHLLSKSIRRQLQAIHYKILIEKELEQRIKEAVNLRSD